MQDLNGKLAVVTGGASGLGLAFAHRFAAEGMRIAIADIEEPVLDQAVAELEATGADVIGVRCDVSDHDSVRNLKVAVDEAFGAAHLLCLNAGVASNGLIVEQSLKAWRWVLGVNLFGIVHGLDVFLPGIIEQGEGHVVVTASICGHTSFAGVGPYNASKHAAVTVAETLHAELREMESAVGVSCLCPGFVGTNIYTAERNRPETLQDAPGEPVSDEERMQLEVVTEWMAANALQPAEVADMVHDAVVSDTFWIFTDEEQVPQVGERQESVRTRRNPTAGRINHELFD